ncbi:MAG TPA: substrate-binding domain-containing protein [Pyrinomonadaceae bacterium]|nr:substrate-binding domain-containing protein [Pyrinomonadaceae bacterium]
MRNARAFITLLSLTFVVLATGCVSAPPEQGGAKNAGGPVKIGFSMDTLKEERWQRDKEFVEAKAGEMGATVIVQVANGDDKLQIEQAENMLTQGVNVLLVAPHNGEVAAAIVESAKKQNVPVISYDRLIKNSDVDLYVSHQVVKIGEMQAKYALDRAPKGNYVIVGGAPTDNNALLLHDGQMNVLKPAIDRGDIKIVADQYAKEWKAAEALNITENALTQTRNDIVAVVCSNDGTAGGAVQAIEEQKLTGKVVVTGQDAELAACQRIVEGKQSMTIYKPIKPLADSAVEAAMKLARGEKVQTTDKINNGMKDVPAILHEPIAVDKSNMADTVIKEGFQKLEAVYQNVPKDQWPKTAAAARVGVEDKGASGVASGPRRPAAGVALALSAALLALALVRRR